MPNSLITPPFSDHDQASRNTTRYNSMTSDELAAIAGGPGNMNDPVPQRPRLNITGSRNSETNEVSVRCRCTGFQYFASPIIALFLCQDARTEPDRFNYVSQSTASAAGQIETDVACSFLIENCPAPPKVVDEDKEDDANSSNDLNGVLTPRSIENALPSESSKPPRSAGPLTQLKFNVYSTNDQASSEDGLQQKDLMGTAVVELERILEQKEGDQRGLSVELIQPYSAAAAHQRQSSDLSLGLSSAITSSTTSRYTTLRIPHQIPPASMGAPTSPPNGLSSTHLYGISEDSIKSVLTTPQLGEDEPHDLAAEHEQYLQQQREEAARAQDRRPIQNPNAAKPSKYDLGKTNSDSLAAHQSKQRLCGSGDTTCSIM